MWLISLHAALLKLDTSCLPKVLLQFTQMYMVTHLKNRCTEKVIFFAIYEFKANFTWISNQLHQNNLET